MVISAIVPIFKALVFERQQQQGLLEKALWQQRLRECRAPYSKQRRNASHSAHSK